MTIVLAYPGWSACSNELDRRRTLEPMLLRPQRKLQRSWRRAIVEPPCRDWRERAPTACNSAIRHSPSMPGLLRCGSTNSIKATLRLTSFVSCVHPTSSFLRCRVRHHQSQTAEKEAAESQAVLGGHATQHRQAQNHVGRECHAIPTRYKQFLSTQAALHASSSSTAMQRTFAD